MRPSFSGFLKHRILTPLRTTSKVSKKASLTIFFSPDCRSMTLLTQYFGIGHAETSLLFVAFYKIVSAANKKHIAAIDGGEIGRVRDNGLQFFQRYPSSIREGRHSRALLTWSKKFFRPLFSMTRPRCSAMTARVSTSSSWRGMLSFR